DGYVYSASSKGGAALVKLKSTGDAVAADEVYFNKKLPGAIGGTVLVDGYLYGTTGKALLCVEFKTGKVKWEDMSIAPASLLYADGRLYAHSDETNDV